MKLMWACREEDCESYGKYNIGDRQDKETGYEEHYCKSCDVPLVRYSPDPDNPKAMWAWRRVGWKTIKEVEEYDVVVTKTKITYRDVRVEDD